jgi:hypothetical protein
LDGLSDHERVSYYSTMPTLEINTLFHPSLIRFAYYMIMSTSRCILLDFPTLEINTLRTMCGLRTVGWSLLGVMSD